MRSNAKQPQLGATAGWRCRHHAALYKHPNTQITAPAPLGCYVHGLVLEGARWDKEEGRLRDSAPGELHQVMPVIQVGAGCRTLG